MSKHAAAALEEALISRRAEITSGKLMLRSDNGLIFGAKAFVAIAKEYGVEQEYITPYTPEQNGMVERFFRSLKEECIWQHRFKSRDEAFEIIAKWMDTYHTERPHSAIGYLTPEAFKKEWKAACTLQFSTCFSSLVGRKIAYFHPHPFIREGGPVKIAILRTE